MEDKVIDKITDIKAQELIEQIVREMLCDDCLDGEATGDSIDACCARLLKCPGCWSTQGCLCEENCNCSSCIIRRVFV